MGGVGGVAHVPAILRFLGVLRLPPLPPEHRIGDGGGEGVGVRSRNARDRRIRAVGDGRDGDTGDERAGD